MCNESRSQYFAVQSWTGIYVFTCQNTLYSVYKKLKYCAPYFTVFFLAIDI